MAYPYLSDLLRAFTGLDLPLRVPMLGIMAAVAMITIAYLLRLELKRLHTCGILGLARRRTGPGGDTLVPPQDVADDLVILVAIVGIVGARVFSVLEDPADFLADPIGVLFSRTGFTYYGGFVFGMVAGTLFLRLKRLPVAVVLDAVAPAIAIGYGIGRLGCQIAGDGDWGIAANMALKPQWLPAWWWAQTYEHNLLGVQIAPPGVYPTPVYESLMALAAFAVLWSLRKHPFQSGWLFSLYLVLTGAARLAIEQIRVNAHMHIGGIALTQAELISSAVLVTGIVGVVRLSRRRAGPPPRANAAPVPPS
jgi:phosphatidylglycerol:prolipoprotein diacylglycerol transferase